MSLFWQTLLWTLEATLKVEDICIGCSPNFLWNKWQHNRIFFSLIRGIFITLWTLYEVFYKNSQRLNTVNYFAESSILDVSRGSEYVSDYPQAFSIIINWRFHFESFINSSNSISILLKGALMQIWKSLCMFVFI